MTDLTTLRALQASVRAAEGPDRGLDADLYATQVAWDGAYISDDGYAYQTRLERIDEAGGRYFRQAGDRIHIDVLQPYTASLDAAVSLIEKVLPGWSYHAERVGEKFCYGRVTPADVEDGIIYERATVPLALLAAMLSALIEKAETAAPPPAA